MFKKRQTALKPVGEGRSAMDKFIAGMTYVSTPIIERRPQQRPNIAELSGAGLAAGRNPASKENTAVRAKFPAEQPW